MTEQHPGLDQLLEKIQRKKQERRRSSLMTFFGAGRYRGAPRRDRFRFGDSFWQWCRAVIPFTSKKRRRIKT
jgi:hypothetical protein